MICPACHSETDAIETVASRGRLITGCESCLGDNLQQGHSGAAKYHRDRQREDYRRDITQKNQPRDYIKAYGIDKAREDGFSEQQLRKYS